MGTGVFPVVASGRGVTLTPQKGETYLKDKRNDSTIFQAGILVTKYDKSL
jgi:hypothetical protein